MAGQPNRKTPREPAPVPYVPVGHGVPGGHEIDAFWEPSVDPVVLQERLDRRKAQVAKLKRDRSDLKAAMRLKTEEAYNDGLLASAPALLEIDRKITDMVNQLLDDGIDDERLKLLKALLPELTKQRDRLYGKTRQRVTSTSVSASVDINELMQQSREAITAGETVVDAEVYVESELESGEGDDA